MSSSLRLASLNATAQALLGPLDRDSNGILDKHDFPGLSEAEVDARIGSWQRFTDPKRAAATVTLAYHSVNGCGAHDWSGTFAKIKVGQTVELSGGGFDIQLLDRGAIDNGKLAHLVDAVGRQRFRALEPGEHELKVRLHHSRSGLHNDRITTLKIRVEP